MLDVVVVVAHGADVAVNDNLLRWRRLLGPQVECIVVDNTPHGVPTGLDHGCAAAAGVTVVSCLDNPGYLGGVFRAQKALDGPRQNFVMIANADIQPLTVQNSVFQDVSPDVGVIGPVHGPASRHRRVVDVTVFKLAALIVRDAVFWAIGAPASRVAADRSYVGESSSDEIMVHGSCFALRRDLLLDLVSVRPRPVLYGEEVLLGWMLARRSQRHLGSCVGFEVEHRHAPTSSDSSGRFRYRHRVRANAALMFHRLTRLRRL